MDYYPICGYCLPNLTAEVDTYDDPRAARRLAKLLCNDLPEPSIQCAPPRDWSLRPLPVTALLYARSADVALELRKGFRGRTNRAINDALLPTTIQPRPKPDLDVSFWSPSKDETLQILLDLTASPSAPASGACVDMAEFLTHLDLGPQPDTDFPSPRRMPHQLLL